MGSDSEFPHARRSSPRELWENESTGFTPWLEKNIDRLNDELGTSFSVLEREKGTPTGFSIDLVIEDEDERQKGVIEGQLTQSDHTHLGQLLTYVTAFEANTAVWIVRDPRYEHKKTIEWLNESTEKSFYLVTIEAVEVEEVLAPLFTVVSEPSPAAKEIGEEKREASERKLKQEEFWEDLLDTSNADFPLFEAISPKQQGWIGKSAGIGGVAHNYLIRNDWGAVELYIDTGARSRNKEIFDDLQQNREEIESKFGGELEWRRLDNKRASRIRSPLTETGLVDEDSWDETQSEMVDIMQRFHQSFEEYIEPD